MLPALQPQLRYVLNYQVIPLGVLTNNPTFTGLPFVAGLCISPVRNSDVQSHGYWRWKLCTWIIPFHALLLKSCANTLVSQLLAALSIVLGIPFPVWIYYKGEAMRARNPLTAGSVTRTITPPKPRESTEKGELSK